MAKTISIAQVTNPAKVGSPTFFTATVTNGDAASAELRSLHISEVTKDGSFISQPNFLTPNATPGTFPTISAGASATYGFSVVFPSPASPGQAPPVAPPRQPGFPVRALVQMRAVGTTSDGTVFTTDFAVAVLSALRPFPNPQGAAGALNRGECSSLIAVIS